MLACQASGALLFWSNFLTWPLFSFSLSEIGSTRVHSGIGATRRPGTMATTAAPALTLRQKALLGAAFGDDADLAASLFVSDSAPAPEGATLASVRTAVTGALQKFENLRLKFAVPGSKGPACGVVPASEVDAKLLVFEQRPGADGQWPTLSPATGRVVAVALCGQTIVARAHALAADRASLRAFLAAVVAPGASRALAPDAASLWGWASREGMSSKESERDAKFWQSVMDETAPVIQMNSDLSRPVRRGVWNSRVCARAPGDLADRIDKLCGPQGAKADAPAVLLAAFALILYRRTLETDLILTAALPTGAGVCGPVNARQAYLRIAIDPTGSFSDLCSVVRARLSEASQRMSVPFAALAEKFLESGEGASADARTRMPIDVRFTPVAFDFDGDAAAFLSEEKKVPGNTEMCLRALRVGGKAGGLQLALDYDSDLFRRETAVDTLDQLLLVLDQTLGNTSSGAAPATIMDVSLVTERARALLPDPASQLDPSWPGDVTSCFTRSAKARPEATAIVFQNTKINYKTLLALVEATADALAAAGIGPGDVVGLYGHRSPPVVWAIMGILKAGAAYTMMDPKYPVDRIQTCLRIANVKGFIFLESARKMPQALRAHLDGLDRLRMFSALPASTDPADASRSLRAGIRGQQTDAKAGQARLPQPHDVAVVTFTSGSTGQPKGVMGRHASLTHFYKWMASRFVISENDRFSMCSGIAHDPLQRDIFTPLFFGAAIHIPTDLDIAEPGRLAQWTAREKITISCFTPAMGQLLVSGDRAKAPELTDFRLAFFVGALLVKRDVQMLRQLAPNVRVINMYGSTETQRAVGYLEIVSASEEAKGEPKQPGNSASHARCRVGMDACKEVIPVGIGMQDCQMLVLNSAGNLTGIGELAEIYMRSPHISLGYIGKAKVTKERFLPNPFGDQTAEGSAQGYYGKLGDRMYKTGDLGRYRFDGFVECCGRADDQIKIRGFRVELGEVNATLSKCPGLYANIVTAREDTLGSKMLLAHVVPDDASGDPSNGISEDGKARVTVRTDADARSLALRVKQFLKKRLPHYMVPSFVIVLSALPLTANGKINTRALPPPAAAPLKGTDSKARAAAYKEPLTPTQSVLVEAWGRILKVQNPPLDASFFDLGGHSLAATHLTLAMRESLGKPDLPVDLLFSHPTIRGLAAAIDNKSSGAAAQVDLDAELKSVCEQCLSDVGSATATERGPSGVRLADASTVALTGATGFLGAFLVRELLARTRCGRLYCLARAKTDAQAKQRVLGNLKNHRISISVDDAKRVVGVAADLSKPMFGLSDGAFAKLAEGVEAVVHNGAYVHWLLPYARLKPTNVLGTHTVLQLASRGARGVSAVHYVSTTSVFDDPYHAKQSVVLESDPLTQWKGLSGGYPQSKWMAERLLMAAAKQRGVPVAIYRPGYVTGDCENGVWNTDDFQCRLIKGCLALGAYPFPAARDAQKRLLALDASPVDYVAEAIVSIAVGFEPSRSRLSAFHIVNPSPYPYAELYGQIAGFGYRMQARPYAEWRAKLQASVTREEGNPLAAVVNVFGENWAANLPNPKYDMKAAEAALSKSTSNIRFWDAKREAKQEKRIECPSIRRVVRAYLKYLVGCGFLAPPEDNKQGVEWSREAGAVALSRSNRT